MGNPAISEERNQHQGDGNKKSELPRFECFHNGIILIVIRFQFVASNIQSRFYKTKYFLGILNFSSKRK
jgi:hypothetical protein